MDKTGGESMNLDIWSIAAIAIIAVGVVGGIWFEHR